MKRTEIINYFIEKNNYQSYCEVGTFNKDHNFNKINCPNKVCVDPDPKAEADYIGTSDEFFKQNDTFFDVVFLDGLHTCIQLFKDINNSLGCLAEGGMILLHDMLPPSKNAQIVPRIQGEWTGDCWMTFVWLRATRSDLTMFTIDSDYGVGVIQRGRQELITIDRNITYENFEKNKKEWLNIKQVSDLNLEPATLLL